MDWAISTLALPPFPLTHPARASDALFCVGRPHISVSALDQLCPGLGVLELLSPVCCIQSAPHILSSPAAPAANPILAIFETCPSCRPARLAPLLDDVTSAVSTCVSMSIPSTVTMPATAATKRALIPHLPPFAINISAYSRGLLPPASDPPSLHMHLCLRTHFTPRTAFSSQALQILHSFPPHCHSTPRPLISARLSAPAAGAGWPAVCAGRCTRRCPVW
jgi:hypothetical protein